MTVEATAASSQRVAMVEEMFARIDTGDGEAIFPYITDDAHLVFGNQPPLVGRDEIRQGSDRFMGMIKGLSHKVLDVFEGDGTVIIRLRVTYTRLDDEKVTIPVVTAFQEENGAISHYQVYFDLTPVLSHA